MAAESPAWQYENGDKTVVFMNCPNLFIPQRVMNFEDVYRAYQGGRARAPEIEAMPRKYFLMCDLYERWIQIFEDRRMDAEHRQALVSSMGRG